MMTAGKLSEFLKANLGGAAVWLSMANYDQATALVATADADEGETLTVQFRRATDGAGANAADLGDPFVVTQGAVSGALVNLATIYASDLGRTAGGVDYTHVAVTITDGASPETPTAVFVLRSHGRYGNTQD